MIVYFSFRSRKMMIFALYVFVSFSLGEIFAFTLVYLILRSLKKKSHLYSKKTYKMHLNFVLLLVCQLLSPICYLFLPFAAATLGALTSYRPGKIAIEFGLLGIVAYGMSSSLLTIFFVTPFRIHFLNTMIFPWLRPLLRSLGFKNVLQSTSKVTVVQVTLFTT